MVMMEHHCAPLFLVARLWHFDYSQISENEKDRSDRVGFQFIQTTVTGMIKLQVLTNLVHNSCLRYQMCCMKALLI